MANFEVFWMEFRRVGGVCLRGTSNAKAGLGEEIQVGEATGFWGWRGSLFFNSPTCDKR